MPSSTSNTIPIALNIVKVIQPSSILDVGVGFGKWGFLFREYLEINRDNKKLISHDNNYLWNIKIDGIEYCERYIKVVQKQIYNNLFIGDAFKIIEGLDSYDLIFLGDVIEHFDKEKGMLFINKCIKKTNNAIIVITPVLFFSQNDFFDNPAEIHKSHWTENDFIELAGNRIYCRFIYIKGCLIAIICKKPLLLGIRKFQSVLDPIRKFCAYRQQKAIIKYGVNNFKADLIINSYYLFRNLKYRIQNKLLRKR